MIDQVLPAGKASFDLRRILFSILFFYMVTPFDFGPSGIGTGVVLLIKCILGGCFIGLALAAKPQLSQSHILVFALGVAGYLMLLNVASISNFALMETTLIFCGIIISDFARGDFKQDFIFVLTVYLWVHLIGLVLALVWYGTVGTIFDFHNLLFPFSKTRAQLQFGLPRVTGFMVEPGDYACWVPLTVLLRSVLIRKIGTPLHMICSLSAILTFSAWASVAAGVYMASAALEFVLAKGISRELRNQILTGMMLIAAVALMAVLVIPSAGGIVSRWVKIYQIFITLRFSKGAGGGTLLQDLVAFRGFMSVFDSIIVFGRPIDTTFCTACASSGASPGGVGLWVYLSYYCGFLPTVTLFGTLLWRLWRRFGLHYALLFSPFLVSRVHMHDILLWTLFGVILFEAARWRSAVPDEAEGAPQASPAF